MSSTLSSGGSNIKVHFVGGATVKESIPLLAANVRYRLFTAYPYIEKGEPKKSRGLNEGSCFYSHTIVDSGLFTLMWGAGKDKDMNPETIRDWMHRLVTFSKLENMVNTSIVEVDCQKLISSEYAWDLRKEMRSLLPDREIINVFHLEDGEGGFRQLIDFSDYIAISIPELRIARPKSFRETAYNLARMARRQKPSIKIHLLGCTDDEMLRVNKFCTSADSSSWTFFVRGSNDLYGFHRRDISDDGLRVAKESVRNTAASIGVEMSDKGIMNAAINYIAADISLKHYIRYAGPQD